MKKLTKLPQFAKFFVKNYQVSILLIIFLIIGGLTGYFQLPREGTPEVEMPFGVVTTIYPGATPQDVENDVTKKVEAVIAPINSIQEVESTSGEGYSSIMATFKADANIDEAMDELRREIASITGLPEEAEDPKVIEIDAAGPGVVMSVVGDYSKGELTNFAEILQNEVEKAKGVKRVDLMGSVEECIFISLKFDEMSKRNITFDQVGLAIKSANLSFPGGTLEKDKKDIPIQIVGQYQSIDDIKETIVGATAFGVVKLSDIANVEERFEGPNDRLSRTGYVKDNSLVVGDSVSLVIYAEQGTDIIEVKSAVDQKVAGVTESDRLPNDIEVIDLYDTAKEVKFLLGDLFTSAWQGLIAILVVLFIFISFRSSIVAVIIIPLVMFATFLVLSFTGLTLNFLTLYALILSLGIVIDNAIVVVEGVQRNIRQGMSRKEASVKIIKDLGGPIITATLTTVLAFVPMMFLGGITGQFVKYIPYTVVITLIASLLIALTLTPFLSRFLLKRTSKGKPGVGKWTESCINWFCKVLWALLKTKKRILGVFIITILLTIGSFSLFSNIEVELWPEVDDAEYFTVTVNYPKNSSDDYKNQMDLEIADHINQIYQDNEEINKSLVNFAALPFFHFGSSNIETFFVNVKPKEDTGVELNNIISVFQQELDKIDGLEEVKAEGFTSGPPEAEYPIEVQIAGDDLAVLEKAALDLSDHINSLEGIKKVDDGVSGEKAPQIRVNLDSQEVVASGVSQYQVALLIRSIYNPEKVSNYIDLDTNESKEIKIEFADVNSIDKLKSIGIGTATLDNIADIEEVEVLRSINRFEQKRYIEVKASVKNDVDATGVTNQISDYFTNDKLNELGLEDDSITFRGDLDSETQAFDDFAKMMVLALLMIFVVLVFQFKSFVLPFITMLAIPLAAIGVAPGLLLTGNPISFMVLLGMVVLVGIVVNNAIILIDRFNKLRKEEGLNRREAIIEGVRQRVRPIISTTLTTIAGIMPLTISQFYWRGMGVTIMAGLIASAIFVLLVIPVIYFVYVAIFDKRKEKN